VDRKQAYLQQIAAQDRVPVKPDKDDECVVEYESDDSKHSDSTRTKVDTANVTVLVTLYTKK